MAINIVVWQTIYGAVGVGALEKDVIVEGMNEKGLLVNVFYHSGFAEYPKFDRNKGGGLLIADVMWPDLITVDTQ